MNELETEVRRVNGNSLLSEEERLAKAGPLQEKLTQLAQKRHRKKCLDVATRNKLEGETISKYWSQINKDKKPRDVIFALKKPEPRREHEPEYEIDSKKMSNLARNYHENLQEAEPVINPLLRAEKTKALLDQIERKATDQQKEELKNELTENDVENALKKSQSGSAAGIDGATYDLWKTLNERFKEDERAEQPAFNVVKLLTAVFNDIERYGVDKDTGFADGWMCPIYKKNDRDEISNYRPITLLNTDYKLLTKALSVKLAMAAPTMIHENQAGFIPGRNIKDQTKLTRMMMEYAEATEHNEMIVALDQEKAYDKIAHDYLWRTLEAFEIPNNFTQTVRSLYEHATTKVMINGHLSKSFDVRRGSHWQKHSANRT
ncbi:hypothetical protein EUX98_g8936 [Antrodiella citrinella]|uniref:Reverse transcriptase domain-containing protein n=1 Tax=Antrodiella citrinella TaxID=2447956 RepID=A0A4S4M0W2_9APHY|nr:hypothetical protein EUX98_g8936 [Antrodiella citrinella]